MPPLPSFSKPLIAAALISIVVIAAAFSVVSSQSIWYNFVWSRVQKTGAGVWLQQQSLDSGADHYYIASTLWNSDWRCSDPPSASDYNMLEKVGTYWLVMLLKPTTISVQAGTQQAVWQRTIGTSQWHTITVEFNYYTKIVYFYHNGDYLGLLTEPSIPQFSWARFGDEGSQAGQFAWDMFFLGKVD